MGRDKLSMDVGGVPLLERVRIALSATCDEVLIVGSPAQAPPGVRPVEDLRPGREGPLAGIEAALTAAGHRRVFVAAGDMPFVSERLVAHALGLLLDGSYPAVVPRHEGREHPLCAAYDARLALPLLRRALEGGERAARAFLAGLEGVRYVEEDELRGLGDPTILLMNVNTPEDLARARAHGDR